MEVDVHFLYWQTLDNCLHFRFCGLSRIMFEEILLEVNVCRRHA